MNSLIFRNVDIYDGLGSDPYVGDVAIDGSYICSVDTSISGKSFFTSAIRSRAK